MNRVLLLGCLVLTLSACGARAPAPAPERDGVLSGMGGFLSRAFASSGDAKLASAPAGGGLCGDPMLVGEVAGAVEGNGVCGIENAVRLRAVGDVALSQSALINCETAKALKTWIAQGVTPAVGKQGGGVAGLKVAASYACRTRNHKRGAKISEHGKGRAIDISAIQLADGSEITVLSDWGQGKYGQKLRAMHAAACGPFGTVLGPESDRFHKDHFHFDTAQYRSGSYCR